MLFIFRLMVIGLSLLYASSYVPSLTGFSQDLPWLD